MYERRLQGRLADSFAAAVAPAPRRTVGEPPRVHHRIGALAVVRAPDDAPMQCTTWKWSAKKSAWEDTSGVPSTATPPAFKGTDDGEVFDDANVYRQEDDPTAKPFLKTGQKYIGEAAIKKQLTGATPDAADVRVASVKPKGSDYGYGLHEVLPTDTRGKVAKSGNEAVIGLQSGARTSTEFTFFNRDEENAEEVGAHTGALPKETGSGSTHTRGQAPAHDRLRTVLDDVITKKTTDAEEAANAILLAEIEAQPHGQQILSSEYLTGGHSRHGTIGAVAKSGASPDAERLRLATEAHDRREGMKERGRSLKRDAEKRGKKNLRSPSPPRTPITSTGSGGEHVTVDRTQFPTVAVPSFYGKRSSYEFAANLGAWATQPMRNDDTGTVKWQASPPPVTQAPSVQPTSPLQPPTTPIVPVPTIAQPTIVPQTIVPQPTAVPQTTAVNATPVGRGRGGRGGRGGQGGRGGRGRGRATKKRKNPPDPSLDD
jgi:hypothetical protein